jgi:hypothetical protein
MGKKTELPPLKPMTAAGSELVNETRMEVVNSNFGSICRGRTRKKEASLSHKSALSPSALCRVGAVHANICALLLYVG